MGLLLKDLFLPDLKYKPSEITSTICDIDYVEGQVVSWSLYTRALLCRGNPGFLQEESFDIQTRVSMRSQGGIGAEDILSTLRAELRVKLL